MFLWAMAKGRLVARHGSENVPGCACGVTRRRVSYDSRATDRSGWYACDDGNPALGAG
jgi:hypothetical protein